MSETTWPVHQVAARPAAADSAVQAVALTKTYRTESGGTVQAVRGVDLDIASGEFFGLIGPNGAGKSTTIGMLNTLITATGGQARVAGFDVRRDPLEVKRRCAVIGQFSSMDRELSVAENLEFAGRYRGLTTRAARARMIELLARFGLTEQADALPLEISGGQLRRMVIARALIQRPQVLFLDEPTSGIDPHSRVALWEMLREMRDEGMTMLLTTHYLEEAEALCDRVAIIDQGQVIACGTVADLCSSGDTVVTVTYDGQTPATVPALAGRDGTRSVQVTGSQVRVVTRRPERLLAELMKLGTAAGVALLDATTLRPSLQSVYLTLTGRTYEPGRREQR